MREPESRITRQPFFFDYVVHENHGLGIYRGIEKLTVDKVTKDYIKIEYAGGGTLYILATGLDIIQKYVVGTRNTTCFLSSTALKAARMAISVFP